MSNNNFKARHLSKLRFVYVFVMTAIASGFIRSYYTAYSASMKETLDLLNNSLVSGIRLTFFIFILLGLFRYFQNKEENT